MKKLIILALFLHTPMGVFAESVSKTEIEEIVKEVLKKNPEIVKEALIAERQKEEAQLAADQTKVIQEHKDQLFNGKLDYRAGNPDGDVTIAMLHDFRCGHCKSAHQRIHSFLEEEKNVKVVFKDLPILGPDSKFAARAALAAHIQSPDKQAALVQKLTTSPDAASDDDVIKFAGEVGLNIETLKKDMESMQVSRELGNTKVAANQMGINSTPTFIISAKGKQQVIPGVLEKSDLIDIVAQARKA